MIVIDVDVDMYSALTSGDDGGGFCSTPRYLGQGVPFTERGSAPY